MRTLIPLLTVAIALASTACSAQRSEAELTPATVEVPEGMQTAVVGAGCFWCVEVFFEHQDGVHEVYSGYSGGAEANPSYKEVAYGRTTHVETVQIVYDPTIVSYRELIDFFWTTHDATRGDGVWPDFGPHYRSILFYQNDDELATIKASRTAYEAETGKQIATDIKAFDVFYPAETYHQDYAAKNPGDRHVQGVLNPKLKKLGLK
ncbi:MAG: peptide-methionine (S)-S-oxide reductase MsrA [Coraliomargarita sp.]